MKFKELSLKEFNKYLDKSDLKTFLQSPMMDNSNTVSYYVGVEENNKIVAAARLTAKKRKFGYNYFSSPNGLLLD